MHYHDWPIFHERHDAWSNLGNFGPMLIKSGKPWQNVGRSFGPAHTHVLSWDAGRTSREDWFHIGPMWAQLPHMRSATRQTWAQHRPNFLPAAVWTPPGNREQGTSSENPQTCPNAHPPVDRCVCAFAPIDMPPRNRRMPHSTGALPRHLGVLGASGCVCRPGPPAHGRQRNISGAPRQRGTVSARHWALRRDGVARAKASAWASPTRDVCAASYAPPLQHIHPGRCFAPRDSV